MLLWLQGGPGGSSLYGMFTEVGPFTIDAEGAVVARDPTSNWNQHYDLVFFDNPCGVGFSFSNDVECYVENEVEVGADVYAALAQFYQLFPAKRPAEGGGGLLLARVDRAQDRGEGADHQGQRDHRLGLVTGLVWCQRDTDSHVRTLTELLRNDLHELATDTDRLRLLFVL